tara:strand:- start:257 stop:1165 length:909 start_codon:yes stop_codon:yes gene_type:complete
METEDYKRKDFQTRKGFIFNLPDDYELDESKGYLFGIIEIPFDAFSSNSNKNISNQRGGTINPCQQALYSLITELLSRGRGRPTQEQTDLRQDITNEIKHMILSAGNIHDVDINLSVESRSKKMGGLFIEFRSTQITNDRGRFHLTIHDMFFYNPVEFQGSMAHTTSNRNDPDRANVQTILKLQCNKSQDGSVISFNLTLRDNLSADDISRQMINIAINVLNNMLFNKNMYLHDNNSWHINKQVKTDVSDTDEFPPLGAGKRRKYKKTKKRTKNIKKKSRKSRKQKRKTRKINKKKNKRSRK